MGKIPNFTDRERFETPKTDCALKIFNKTKKTINLDSRFVDLENTGYRATLSCLSCHTNSTEKMDVYVDEGDGS